MSVFEGAHYVEVLPIGFKEPKTDKVYWNKLCLLEPDNYMRFSV